MPDPHAPLPRRLGDYELELLVADDETGTAYRALDVDGRVLLRVFSDRYAGDADTRLALFAGLQDHAALTHSHILEAAPEGPRAVDGAITQPLRWVRCRGLRAILDARGAMSWPAACAVALDVCQALAHAHRMGLPHGDVRPEHCFMQDPLPAIGRERRTLLTGFGLAAAYRMGLPIVPRDVVPDDATRAAFPPHMAPEVAQGLLPDVRSDIYGVGALIVHLVTGAPPRTIGWPPAIERIGGKADSYRDDAAGPPALPPAVEREILRATARDPALRHPSIDALVSALFTADPSALEAQAKLARRGSTSLTLPIDPPDLATSLLVGGVGYIFLLLVQQCMSR